MPLNLSDNEMSLLANLAAPIDQKLRPEFMQRVATVLEAQPSAVGVGTIHRIARQVQREFWQPPQFGEGRR